MPTKGTKTDSDKVKSKRKHHRRKQHRNDWIKIFVVILSIIASVLLLEYMELTELRCDTNFVECCVAKNIDLKKLEKSWNEKVFGQHIALKSILKSLKHHQENKLNRALLMTFIGGKGTGKNSVAKLLAENMFDKADSSSHVHVFDSVDDFPKDISLANHMKALREWIIGNTTRCRYSMFIFDKVDQMPTGLIDTLLPFVTSEIIKEIDYRKNIFILMGNFGADFISNTTFNLLKSKTRINQQINDFNQLRNVISQSKGLSKCKLLQLDQFNSLIDYPEDTYFNLIVPFLPLERRHIRFCIRKILREFDEFFDEDILLENKIASELDFFPEVWQLYATNGCSNCRKATNKYLKSNKGNFH